MGQAERDGDVWRLYRGQELVGEIRGAHFYAMFRTEGQFHPRDFFEQDLRALFEDASEGLRTGDFERSGRASRIILETLTLTDPDGAPVPLFNLVIEGDSARFRLKRAD
ncbi:hypothetical protein ACNTMW_20140 [Planosporangium sp. 12N6]|uniref:hypothetical protein n=1 Tax=Planosporangium spinosum TaxID=3402278 RepID=UPI003CED047F